jgi:hypothetical protein
MTTSAEWTPSDGAWRQAASTAGNPSVTGNTSRTQEYDRTVRIRIRF